MIPASKQRHFNAWFAGHARDRIQSSFAGVLVHGLARARQLTAEAPILVLANHTSWWDPLVALHVSEHLLGADGHAMMDAKNLRRLPFFAHVGAFGVDLERPADGAASIKYAARLLDRPRRLVWLFPQGRERPITERPLGFRPGAAQIARVAREARALPVGIRYECAGEERPFLYVSLGEPLAHERDVDRARVAQEGAVEAELDRIERAVRGDASDFEAVHKARAPWLGSLATCLLARVTGALRAHDLRLPPGRDPSDRS